MTVRLPRTRPSLSESKSLVIPPSEMEGTVGMDITDLRLLFSALISIMFARFGYLRRFLAAAAAGLPAPRPALT